MNYLWGGLPPYEAGKAKVDFEWAVVILILALISLVAVYVSLLLLVPAIMLSDQSSKIANATDELRLRFEVPIDQTRPSKPAELSQVANPVSEGRCNEATALE